MNFYIPNQLKVEISALQIPQDGNKTGRQSMVVTTDPSMCEAGIFDDCEFAGFRYDWPAYHDGVITMKPVLEVLARRVLSS